MMLVPGTTRNMSVMAILTLFMAILVVMNVFHHSKILLGRLVAKAD
jgi:hypothetical protein